MFFGAVLFAAGAGTGQAQTNEELQAIRKEIEALKQTQQAILAELQALRQALATRQQVPAQPAAVSIAGAPSKGSRTAPLVLVEFSDYQ